MTSRLVLTFSLSVLFVAAQVGGWMEGVISDPSGARVAGVAVRVVDEATGAARTTTSDVNGHFALFALPAGSARVEVSPPGFAAEAHTGIVISSGRVTRHDIRLRLKDREERIEVVAQAPLLSTSVDNWGGAVTMGQLSELPLKGRDAFDLAIQQPGAKLATSAARSTTNGLGIPVAVDGARPNMNSFRMDGLSINDASGSAPASAGGRLLGIETIQELSFLPSPFSAEYGRAAGAIVAAVSRSGGNQWRGSLYEYWRNSALDAKNYFDARGEKIPPLRKNQFGGTASGPVKKNLLFFLANLEVLRENTASTYRPATLTEEARRGLLPGGVTVPVSPVIKPFLDLFPLPNGRSLGSGTAEFVSAIPTRTRESLFSGKGDYTPRENLRFAGRYSFDTGKQSSLDYFRAYNLFYDSHYHITQGSATHVISPVSTQEFRAGFSRISNSEDYSAANERVTALSFVPGMPTGVIQALGLDDFGGSRDLGIRARPRRYTLDDLEAGYQFNAVRGAHSIRFGAAHGNVRFFQQADIVAMGLYNFGSIQDLLQARTLTGDFMYPGSDTLRHWTMHQFAGFAQDEVRLHRRMTLLLGLRYEPYTVPRERDRKVATLPNPLHDTKVTVGGPVFRNPSLRNFAPRLSLAMDVLGDGKTVIRAGWGMFYDLLGSRELLISGVRMPPFYRRAVLTNPRFPNLLEAAAGAPPSETLDLLDYHQNQPYLMKQRLALERRFGGGTLVRLTYAGSRGVHLGGILGEFNTRVPRLMPDGRLYFAPDAPRRNPAIGRFRIRMTHFNSFYHGGSAELQQQWRSGLRVQASYTFSRSIDDVMSVINRDFLGPEPAANPFDRRMNRGLSDFDIRHSLAVNGSWKSPSLTSRPAALRLIAGGWQVHVLMLARTGPPLGVSVGFDRANLFGGSQDLGQRPDLVAGSAQLVLGGPDRYFNPLAFSLPEAGYFGNLGRNVMTGPGLLSLDAALDKAVWRTERHMLRLRLEVFNLTNHVNFQIPSDFTLFNTRGQRLQNAGRITQTATPPRQIQIAARWEF
ncbi:MAG: TonB-dependent receptor [Acidobacteria bacterium]|nr:TonB-dependent receptor [Acidobacteriota bacterium]